MGNNTVTPHDLRQQRTKHDTNNDNMLGFEEAKALAKELAEKEGLSKSLADSQLRMLFDKMDKDGSGYITFDEFGGAAWALLQQMRQANAKGKGKDKGKDKGKGPGKGPAGDGAGKSSPAAPAEKASAKGAGKSPSAAASAERPPGAGAAAKSGGKGGGKSSSPEASAGKDVGKGSAAKGGVKAPAKGPAAKGGGKSLPSPPPERAPSREPAAKVAGKSLPSPPPEKTGEKTPSKGPVAKSAGKSLPAPPPEKAAQSGGAARKGTTAGGGPKAPAKSPGRAPGGKAAEAPDAELAALKRAAVQKGMLLKEASGKTAAELRAWLREHGDAEAPGASKPKAPSAGRPSLKGKAAPAAKAGPPATKEEMEAAATKIQAMRRGKVARKQVEEAKAASKASPKPTAKPGVAAKPTPKLKGESPPRTPPKAKAGGGAKPGPAPKAGGAQGKAGPKAGAERPASKQERDAAASKIQAAYRGSVTRQDIESAKAKAGAKGKGPGGKGPPKAAGKGAPKQKAKAVPKLTSEAAPKKTGKGSPKPGAVGPKPVPKKPSSKARPASAVQEATEDADHEYAYDFERPDRGLVGEFDLDPTDELLGGLHEFFGWATTEAPPEAARQQEQGRPFAWPWDQPPQQGQQQGQPFAWPWDQPGQEQQQQPQAAPGPWWLFGAQPSGPAGARAAKARPAAAPSAAVRRRRPSSVTAASRSPEPVDRRFPMAPQLRGRREEDDAASPAAPPRGRSAPHSRRRALQERFRDAELQQLQCSGATALLPEDPAELSAPESQESAESISGDVVRSWDPTARDKRYHYPRDRAVQFSQTWRPLDWSQRDWEKMLRETGALAPPEQRQAVEQRRSVARERKKRKEAEDRPEAIAPPPEPPPLRTLGERPDRPLRTLGETLGGAAAGTASSSVVMDDEDLEEWRRMRQVRRQRAEQARRDAGDDGAREPKCDISHLRVRVVSASSLATGTFNLSNDPYVRVRIEQQTKYTRVLKKTSNPYWDEVLDFQDLIGNETVTFTVWDQDMSQITQDALLGRLDLSLRAFEKRLLQGQAVKVHEPLRHQLKKDGMAELSVELALARLDEEAPSFEGPSTGGGEEALESADGVLREDTLNALRAQAVQDYTELNRSMGSVPLFPDYMAPGPGQAWL